MRPASGKSPGNPRNPRKADSRVGPIPRTLHRVESTIVRTGGWALVCRDSGSGNARKGAVAARVAPAAVLRRANCMAKRTTGLTLPCRRPLGGYRADGPGHDCSLWRAGSALRVLSSVAGRIAWPSGRLGWGCHDAGRSADTARTVWDAIAAFGARGPAILFRWPIGIRPRSARGGFSE